MSKEQEFTVRRLHVEFADGTMMVMEFKDRLLPDSKEESPCCRLCGWNPKFGEMKDLCFCTMGKHFKITVEPRKLPGGNGR